MQEKWGKREKKGCGGENIPDPQLEFHLSTIYIYSNSSDARHFFVGSTPTPDAGDRNIIDELARMFEETVLNFNRGPGHRKI